MILNDLRMHRARISLFRRGCRVVRLLNSLGHVEINSDSGSSESG